MGSCYAGEPILGLLDASAISVNPSALVSSFPAEPLERTFPHCGQRLLRKRYWSHVNFARAGKFQQCRYVAAKDHSRRGCDSQWLSRNRENDKVIDASIKAVCCDLKRGVAHFGAADDIIPLGVAAAHVLKRYSPAIGTEVIHAISTRTSPLSLTEGFSKIPHIHFRNEGVIIIDLATNL